MTELQTAALLCEMGRAHFFQKIMCFLLYFTVHSKCEGPTITPNSVCQHLSCDGWQNPSVRPRGTDVCSSQHPTRRNALARQRCWQTSVLCTAARKKQPQLPQPLRPTAVLSSFYLREVTFVVGRNLELLKAEEVLLLTCPSAFCHY